MMKVFKGLLAMSCVAALLSTAPGITVLAEEISIADESISEDYFMPGMDESLSEPIEAIEEDASEISVPEENVSDAEEIEEEYTSDVEVKPEEITSAADDAETEIPEETVGEGEAQTFTVGDGVTATLVKEGDKNVLYFDSESGTLWRDWQLKLWGNVDKVQIIKFTEDSNVMYLPKDSSYLFSGYGYGYDSCMLLRSVEQMQLDKVDTSNVENMNCMFYYCTNLTDLDLSSFDTSNVTYMYYMFCNCTNLTNLDLSSFDTSNVTYMEEMFYYCTSLTNLDLSSFDTTNVTNMEEMFACCTSLTNLDLSGFDTTNVERMDYMFYDCSGLTNLDLSSFDTSNVMNMDYMFYNCSGLTNLDLSGFDMTNVYYVYRMFYGCTGLTNLKTPKHNFRKIPLPKTMYDRAGKEYTDLPIGYSSIELRTEISIEKASVGGVSLSYGYSGKAYTPALTIKVGSVTLTQDTDYTVKYENNKNPGTATITITGKGIYTGKRIKTFEIVDCVSTLVSGKTYQLIPKNNSKTAVCSFSGRMINNTKAYITDRSSSEAMKFKAVKNSDGTWKFINAKCELALAVQQNSSEVGKGLVLYDQTTRTAQNWKLEKKSDNSFAIRNAVTGYSIAMSDASAVKGTTLSMAVSEGSGLQRFYIAETEPVSAPFNGTYAVRASKNKNYVLNIASASKEDGANVNLYAFGNTNEKKFKALYSAAGYYRLVNVNSGLVLTVQGNTKADGANVIQSKWAAQSGQRWMITKNTDGTVTLTNALGTVLHLTGNKTANGTNIVVKKASTTTAQKWYLQ